MKRTIELPDQIVFTIADQTYSVPTDDLTDEALTGLLLYGRRKANDTFNSQKGGKNPLTAEQVIEKIRTWDFNRTGGSRISPLTRALREVVKAYLQSAGWKATDAEKAAKAEQAGFRDYLADRLAAKRGVPVVDVPDADVDAAFDRNWPKVVAKAQAMVDAATADELDV